MMDRSVLETLCRTYVDLNRLNAGHGERSHMLAYSITFIEREIRKLLKPPPPVVLSGDATGFNYVSFNRRDE